MWVLLVISATIYLSLSYTAALFFMSRRRRQPMLPAPDDLFFVFVLPCLNEELVIGRSLARLLALPGGDFAVLVVDDGSEDATSEIVRGVDDERVWLLRRDLPDARQGKGEALNAAFAYLRSSGILDGRQARDVVLAVVDADGRLASHSLTEVAPYFRDPRVGAVQIGVRMYNAGTSLLTRMQDLEFVTFTEVFQRARERLGSVGLGGNGQFARLSALESLGDAPWSDCLTEDLDLGIRLLTAGWVNRFCPTTHVEQQAVTSLRRLIRQRARWFQGHLQCWKRIPGLLRSSLPPGTTADLVQHLLSPALVLATSLLLLSLFVGLGAAAATSPLGFAHAIIGGGGMRLFVWYLLAFGIAHFYEFTYWMREDSVSYPQALFYAHAYSIYSYFWFLAGWRAVGRIVSRRSSWAKTSRTAEAPLPTVSPPPSVASPPARVSMVDPGLIPSSSPLAPTAPPVQVA